MRSLFAALCVMLITFSGVCQEKPSKYALSFGIGENLTLTKFRMDIALKRIFDEDTQLRLFISPRAYNNDREIEQEDRNDEIKRTSYSIGVGTDYLWTLLRDEDIILFGGPGVEFTYGNNKEEGTQLREDGQFTYEGSSRFFNAGIRGIIGVEWMVTGKIGIHSEYYLFGYYFWEKAEQTNTTIGVPAVMSISKSKGMSLGTGMSFGVSIYL